MTAPMQSLSVWESLSVIEQRREARHLARHLPAGWAFVGINSYSLGGQQHRIALFSWCGTRFALIPGGDALLGYDRQRPYRPVPSEHEDQVISTQVHPDTFHTLLHKHCTPLRHVSLKPFLFQIKAKPLDPKSHALAFGRRRGGTTVQFFFPADVAAQLSQEGFRLPTSACVLTPAAQT